MLGALGRDDLVLDALTAFGPAVEHPWQLGGGSGGPVVEVLEALADDPIVGAVVQPERGMDNVLQLAARQVLGAEQARPPLARLLCREADRAPRGDAGP